MGGGSGSGGGWVGGGDQSGGGSAQGVGSGSLLVEASSTTQSSSVDCITGKANETRGVVWFNPKAASPSLAALSISAQLVKAGGMHSFKACSTSCAILERWASPRLLKVSVAAWMAGGSVSRGVDGSLDGRGHFSTRLLW